MIYIHIPFCVRKCLYCDFFSVTDNSLYKAYADRVIREIEKYRGLKTETVYIGGGTPTVIGNELVRIAQAVRKNFCLDKECEFTVETNPKTASQALFDELSELGVNRISLGAQSFSDNELKALGRIHNSDDIYQSVRQIKQSGISNISLDLMFAIPHQTPKSLCRSIDEAVKLEPTHISAYSLIIEDGTPFSEMDLTLPGEDEEREMYYTINSRLESCGYYRYEISNYAKPGYESRHNSRYWQDYEYIGIGAGAHSYVDKTRYNNVCSVEEYIKNDFVRENVTHISDEERKCELFMLGLRMKNGIVYNGEFEEKVNRLIKQGLLEIKGNRLMLSQRGTDLANLVFREFLYEQL